MFVVRSAGERKSQTRARLDSHGGAAGIFHWASATMVASAEYGYYSHLLCFHPSMIEYS